MSRFPILFSEGPSAYHLFSSLICIRKILTSHTFRAGRVVAETLSFPSREVIFRQTTRGSKSQGYQKSGIQQPWEEAGASPWASLPAQLNFLLQLSRGPENAHQQNWNKSVNRNCLPESLLKDALKNVRFSEINILTLSSKSL